MRGIIGLVLFGFGVWVSVLIMRIAITTVTGVDPGMWGAAGVAVINAILTAITLAAIDFIGKLR